MYRMRYAIVPLILATLSHACIAEDAKSKFKPLFNGVDLTGWVRVNTPPSTWSVKDSMLVCTGKPIGEIRTKEMYQNFILELEWRHLVPKGNAGVFVWADDITARGVPFHRSIEVQVLENAYGNTRGYTTHGDIFPIHGAKMKPVNGRGGSRAFPTENRSNPSPEWNHYRIECRDGAIALAVNGKVVTRGSACTPRKGYICLESEGGVVHYRNIRIKTLPDIPVTEDDVAIADRGYRALYSGLDLGGWKSSGNWKSRDWTLSYAGPADGSIETVEQFGDVGFICDFKSDDVVEIELRGARISIPPDHAAREKGWNRIEATLKGGTLRYVLNRSLERTLDAAKSQPSGPLVIRPKAGADFANIYVRMLQD